MIKSIIIGILVCVCVVCFITTSIRAEEEVNVSVVVKSTYIDPDNGSSLHKQGLESYLTLGKWIGGVEIDYQEAVDYISVKPLLLYRLPNWNIGLSYLIDSSGAKFLTPQGHWRWQIRPWLSNSLKLAPHLDLTGDGKSFFELFNSSRLSLTDRWFIDLDLANNFYWPEGENSQFVRVRPGYKLSDCTEISIGGSQTFGLENDQTAGSIKFVIRF